MARLRRMSFGADDSWQNPQAYAIQMPDPGMDKAAFQRRNRQMAGDYTGLPENNNGLLEKAAGAITRGIAPLRRIADQGLFGNGPAPRLFDKKGQFAYGGQIDPSFDKAGLFDSRPPNVDPRQGGYGFELMPDRLQQLEALPPRAQASYERMPTRDFAPSGWDEGPPEPQSGYAAYASPGRMDWGSPPPAAPPPQRQSFLQSPELQGALADSFMGSREMYGRGMNARMQQLGRFHDFNNHDMNRAMAADTWGSIGDIANLFGNTGMSSAKGYQEYRQRLNDVAGRQALNNQFTDDLGQRQKDIFNMLQGTDPNNAKYMQAQSALMQAQARQMMVPGQLGRWQSQNYTDQMNAGSLAGLRGGQVQHMQNQDMLGNAKLTEQVRQHDLANQVAQRKLAQGDIAGAQRAQQIADQIRRTIIMQQNADQQGAYQSGMLGQGQQRLDQQADNDMLDFLSSQYNTDSANYRAGLNQFGINQRAAAGQNPNPMGGAPVPKMNQDFINGQLTAQPPAMPQKPQAPPPRRQANQKQVELGSGKPLTPEVVAQFKAQFKGNRELAIKAMRAAGFQVPTPR